MLFFYWAGYLLKLKAPLVTVIPGYWSFCSDIAIVNYASYLSGHHVLNGLSLWSFNESLGNNFYLHILARYFNPFNILGAALVDLCKADIFQVFGAVNFIMLNFAALSSFYYFRKVAGYSAKWSLFGVLVYISLPFISYSAHFANYLGIIAFFPACLIAIDAFYKKISSKTAIGLMLILSAPLFFGMINIYINYLLMAVLVVLVYIFRVKDRRPRFKVFWITIFVFFAALLVNLVVWGPVFLEMLKSTGQSYAVSRELSVINPLELPLQLAGRVFLGVPLSALFGDSGNKFFMESVRCFLSLNRIGLLIFLAGVFSTFRMKRFLAARVWLCCLLGFGVLYYIFSFFGQSVFVQTANLLKVFKYQERIAAPFIALFIIAGARELLENKSLQFRRFTGAVLFVFIIVNVAILWILIHSFSHAQSAGQYQILPAYRWEVTLGNKPGTALFMWLLAFNIVTAVILLCKTFLLVRSKLFTYLTLGGIVIGIGYFEFLNYGGFSVQNEIYAKDYFAAQENEKVAGRLLRESAFQYRALYYDDIAGLNKLFPDDPLYRHVTVPVENAHTWFAFDTRKYMNRADALGIPIADGWLVFPTAKKKAFFNSDPGFSRPFTGMDELAWDMTDPFGQKTARDVSVKYIISHYPLPKLKLINRSSDYWAYLYEIEGAVPICSAELQDASCHIESFGIFPDQIRIVASAKNDALIRLNMTLDNYWKAQVNGKESLIMPIEQVFSGIPVKPGRSFILLKYDYWPLRLFSSVSIFAFILFISFSLFFKFPKQI